MKRVISLLFLAALALAGCRTPPRPAYASVHFKALEPSSEGHISRTPLGETLTSEVGEVVYSESPQLLVATQMVKLDANVVSELEVGHAIKAEAGQQFELRIGKPTGQKAVCLATVLSKVHPQLPHHPQSACLVDVDSDGTFDEARFAAYAKSFPLPSPLPYTVFTTKPDVRPVPEAISRAITYSGSSGGALRLLYREYTGTGLARTAFTQEVSYQLDARGQAEVGFRGLRLQVMSATNSRLTYRIIRAMD